MSTRGTAHGIPAPEPGHRPPGGGGDATHNTARYAVLRTFRAPSRAFRIATVVLAALVLLAVVAWIVQLRDGMGVAGYTDRSFWAIYIADVVAFIGVSYGGAVVSAILMLAGASWRAPLVRIAEGVALVTVIVGAAYIIPHLGRPDRLIGMITHANTSSPVFWDMVAILTYLVATVVFFVLPLIPDTATLLAEHPDELAGRIAGAGSRSRPSSCRSNAATRLRPSGARG